MADAKDLSLIDPSRSDSEAPSHARGRASNNSPLVDAWEVLTDGWSQQLLDGNPTNYDSHINIPPVSSEALRAIADAGMLTSAILDDYASHGVDVSGYRGAVEPAAPTESTVPSVEEISARGEMGDRIGSPSRNPGSSCTVVGPREIDRGYLNRFIDSAGGGGVWNLAKLGRGDSPGARGIKHAFARDPNGNIIGGIGYEVSPGGVNILEVYVQPEYRRQGIATSLVEDVKSSHPDLAVSVSVTKPTDDAQGFWRSQGVKNPNDPRSSYTIRPTVVDTPRNLQTGDANGSR